MQVIVHPSKSSRFLLSDSLNRDACHHAHYVTDVIDSDCHPLVFAVFLPLFLCPLQIVIKCSLGIAQLSSLFIPLGPNNPNFFLFDVFDLLLNVHNFLGNVDVIQMHPRTHFVHRINGLIGKVSVCDISCSQIHARVYGLTCICNTVMLFVLVLDIVQNLNRLFDGGRLYQHLLKTTLQCSILFDVLSVFVQRRSSNALKLTAR